MYTLGFTGSINKAALEAINAPHIRSLELRLKRAYFDSNTIEDEFFRILSTKKTKSIWLSYVTFSDSRWAQIESRPLSNKFFISHMHLSKKAIESLTTLIRTNSLIVCNLISCTGNISCDIVRALFQSSSITDINLSGSTLPNNAFLGTSLSEAIEEINVTNTQLDQRAFEHLCNSLTNARKLKRICIAENKITDLTPLTPYMTPTLTSIVAFDNNLSRSSMERFVFALPSSSGLEGLHISPTNPSDIEILMPLFSIEFIMLPQIEYVSFDPTNRLNKWIKDTHKRTKLSAIVLLSTCYIYQPLSHLKKLPFALLKEACLFLPLN